MKKIAVFFMFWGLLIASQLFVVSAEATELDFYEMFDEHGSIMLIIDPQSGAIIHANKAAAKFYGYTIEQLQSMHIQQINTLNPEETGREMQMAEEEQKNHFIFKHRLADGEIRTVEVYSYPYMHGGTEVLFSIISDITEKTLLEQKNRVMTRGILISAGVVALFFALLSTKLIRSNKILHRKNEEINDLNKLGQTFIDAHNDLVYLKDEDLRYIFVNKAVERFYNKKAEEIIGFDDYALTEKEFADRRRKTDIIAIEKNTISTDNVWWQDRIYHNIKFPVRLPNGHYGVGAYIRDVTEENTIRRKLEQTAIRNSILLDVSTHSFASTQEQLDYVLNESLALTGSKFGYIYMYNGETREFVLNSWSRDVMDECMITEKQTRYELEKTGIWGEVVRQNKPIIVNDFISPNPLKKGYPDGHVQLVKYMTVPVVMDEEIVAVIGLANKDEDYTENDINQVTILMNGVWNSLERRERSIELEKTNEALKEDEDKLKMILDSAAEGIYGIDTGGNCSFCNASALRLLGYRSEGELLGKNMHWLIHHTRKNGGDYPLEECKINKSYLHGERVHVDDEVFWRADGSFFETEYFSYPQYKDGKIVGAVVTFMDVTERKMAEKEIVYLSYHDALTGLYNRRFFEEELRRSDTVRNLPLVIIMGDVNELKFTNDVFGHAAGDQLLRKAAEAFTESCRADDIIARWGGDEFIIVLPKTNIEEAERIMARIKSRLAENGDYAGNSISLGCTAKTHGGEDILQIIKDAETKMYSQKTLERAMINSGRVNMLIRALHDRSPGEKEHSHNVSIICRKLGMELALSETENERLRIAGFLHDIGKITFPKTLLDQYYLPADQDWQEIRQHPLTGHRILGFSDETADLAGSVLAHHERWDGEGYPKGLKGEEIPLFARIIALAESYDAMISGSALRKALTREAALVEIREKAGTQFDPDMVELFLKMSGVR